MAKKKRKQTRGAEAQPKQSNREWEINWDLVGKISTILSIPGSIYGVHQFLDFFRSDSHSVVLPRIIWLVLIVWLVVLIQLIRKQSNYATLLVAVTVLGGVVGGIYWQSYNQTQEDRVIVLIAQLDGPEEKYHLRDEILKQLKDATRDYEDTEIVPIEEKITEAQGSEYARKRGKEKQADLVIWGWYTDTEKSNLNLYIENLSPNEILILRETETYQPQATLAQLESTEIQIQLGSEMSSLVSYLTGVLRYKSGDYQTAIDRFEHILGKTDVSTFINPFDLYFYLGNSYHVLRDYETAIQNYSKGIEINPESAEAYTNLGTAYNSIGDYVRAIPYFDKALEIDPQDATAYNNRGHSYVNLGVFESAIQDFGKAIEIDPQAQTAYGSRGISYFSIGEYEKAFQNFDMAIEIFPHNPFNYFNRGYAYSSLGEYEKAIQDFNKVIQISPQFPNAYSNRGEAYFELEQYELAIKDFDRAIEIDPFNSILYTNRGIAHANLKQYNLAFQDYEKAIQINPQTMMAYYNRGFDYYDTEQYLLALLDFNKGNYPLTVGKF